MSDKNILEEVKRTLDLVVEECRMAFEDINEETRKVVANCERKAKRDEKVIWGGVALVIVIGVGLLVGG